MFKRAKYHLPKFEPPQVTGLCLRERLFIQLDELANKRVVWMSSPAGSGKTSLIASYLAERDKKIIWYQVDAGDGDIASFFHHMALCIKNAYPKKRGMLPDFTSEYLAGLPAFSLNYFRELFKKVEPGSVLVLDNFQDAGEEASLHEVMQYVLKEVPDGVQIVILSRVDPPGVLALFQTSPQFALLSMQDVHFDREESDDVAELRSEIALSETQYAQLYELTQGWAAGLILTLTHLKVDPDFLSHHKFNDRTALFNYVAQEIVAEFDDATRQVLFKTSFLKRISLSVAEKLTAEPRTKKILHHLSSNHLLTIQHNHIDNSFEYHPLFREFLLLLVHQELNEEECLNLQYRAAKLLLDDGDIQSAAKLFIKINNWDALSLLIKKYASGLIQKGLNLTLQNWLCKLPDHLVSNDAWLMYWLGGSQLVIDPKAASINYDKANKLFFIVRDRKGVYLSWIGMATCVLFETDDYQVGNELISLHTKIQSQFPGYPDIRIRAEYIACVFVLMMFIDPLHEEFITKKKEMERQYKIIPFKKEKVLIGMSLINYYFIFGDTKKLAAVGDHLWKYINNDKMPPFHKICICYCKILRSYVLSSDADINVAHKTAEDLEQRYGVTLIRFWFPCYVSMFYLTLEKNEESRKYIDISSSKIDSSRRMEGAHSEYTKSWHAMNNGLIDESARNLENCMEYFKGTNVYVYEIIYRKAYIVVLLELGEIEKADGLLKQFEKKYNDARFKFVDGYSLPLVRAYYYLVTGDEKKFLLKMKSAIQHGEKFNVSYTGYWINRHMAKMFAKCLTHGIGENYIKRVIKLRNILPPSDLIGSDVWPYPVRIYTLGRFSILINGQSHELMGKSLELLKVLLAFGGRNVPEEKLTDALWPDSDGDQASSNFKTTLHRLRKTFDDLDILPLHNHQLSLNDNYCWVDSWCLSRLFSHAQSLADDTAYEMVAAQATEITQAYTGHFLANEMAGWAIYHREKLRMQFVRHVVALADKLEKDYPDIAVGCYQRLLEIDPYIEEAYQGLIRTYQFQGKQAGAMLAYQQCTELFANKGLTLSDMTHRLHQNTN